MLSGGRSDRSGARVVRLFAVDPMLRRIELRDARGWSMKRRAAVGHGLTQPPAGEAEPIDRDRRETGIQQVRQLLWRKVYSLRGCISVVLR